MATAPKLPEISERWQISELEGYPSRDSSALSDEQQLRRLGKKPLLKRNFAFMTVPGFSCSTLITWEAILVVSVQGLLNGGPAGVIWGFLINWMGILSASAVIAEIASIASIASGQCKYLQSLMGSGH